MGYNVRLVKAIHKKLRKHVAELSKAWVCGHLTVGTDGSNPTRRIGRLLFVYLCVVR